MLYAIYFSPTDGTKKCVLEIVSSMNQNYKIIDLTKSAAREQKYSFIADDKVVIGMPVYCSRLPQFTHFLRNMKGNGAKMVLVAAYGNNKFGDALLELNCQAVQVGFQPVAGAAMLASHCFIPEEVCSDRPNAADHKLILEFVSKIDWDKKEILSVPGAFPYRPYPASFPFLPETTDGCTHCRICEEICPVGAIKNGKTDATKCIRCMACVKNCPNHCRQVNSDAFRASQQRMLLTNEVYKTPEFFY